MSYAIENVTLEEVIESIEEQGLAKDIYSKLFEISAGSRLVFLYEDGQIGLDAYDSNTYSDQNVLFTLSCGWDLESCLMGDDDYVSILDDESEETGEWYIQHHADAFEYWYEYAEWDIYNLIQDAFSQALEYRIAERG